MQLELHINNTNIKSKCISKTISKIFYKWILWEVISFEPQQLRHWGKLMWLVWPWPPVSSRHNRICVFCILCLCIFTSQSHICAFLHFCIFARHQCNTQIEYAAQEMRADYGCAIYHEESKANFHYYTWPKIYGKNGVQRTMVLPAVDIFVDHNGLKCLWWSIDHRIW